MTSDPATPRNFDRSLGDGGMALLALIGLSFDGYGEGWAEAQWNPTELACNPAGIVHGGVYGVVHDAAMNFATATALARGDRSATLDLQYQTIRAAAAGAPLRVRGEVTRAAKSVAHVECRVRDADDNVVSHATGTFILRRTELGP